ncbi:uncharacterized protein LOC121402804 [Xenopus laevis]|uniref:ribonuclease H n=1 Tax=Xenopus laevis TaxID=8355 RepID=A0A8J1MUG6_XENLA|nr:uncharacterized protein LOC121402804 [Xenopus laevis]
MCLVGKVFFFHKRGNSDVMGQELNHLRIGIFVTQGSTDLGGLKADSLHGDLLEGSHDNRQKRQLGSAPPHTEHNEIRPAQTCAVGARLALFKEVWAENIRDRWVLEIIREGYHLEFSRIPRYDVYRVSLVPKVQGAKEIVQEYMDQLLETGAVEPVPREQRRRGFYSKLFLVKKSSGAFRPVLDLRPLNQFIRCRKFKMESLTSIIAAIPPRAWLVNLDLKDAYFHVPVYGPHRKYLRFVFQEQHVQFTCLPFGLSTSPRTFSKVLVTVIALLRVKGVPAFHYLDDILLVSNSEEEAVKNRDKAIGILQLFGWVINWQKSHLVPTQKIIFLGASLDTLQGIVSLPDQKVSYIMDRVRSFQQLTRVSVKDCMSILGLFSSTIQMVRWARWHMRPLQIFFSGFRVDQSHKSEETSSYSKSGDGEPRLVVDPEKSNQRNAVDRTRLRHNYNRRLSNRLGSHVRRSVSSRAVGSLSSSFQCIGVEGNKDGSIGLLGEDNTQVGENPFRQCHGGGICTQTRRHQECAVDTRAVNYHVMGRIKPKRFSSLFCTRQNECAGGFPKQKFLGARRMVPESRCVPDHYQEIWQSRDRPHGLGSQPQVQEVLFKVPVPDIQWNRCPKSELERDVRVCLSTLSINLEGIEENRQRGDTGDCYSPILAQASLVSTSKTDVSGASNETSSYERSADAGPSSISGGVPPVSEGVEVERQRLSGIGLNKDLIELLLKSRKHSTSSQYYRVWSCFVKFAEDKGFDPRCPGASELVQFLFAGYQRRLSVSTLRGQVSALSALTERSWAEDPLVIRLFNALKRVCPIRRLGVPPWDLPLVLKVLMAAPFEPLEKASDWHVTLKALFLVAITSACRVGEIHSLSAKEPDTVVFPDKVVLRPAFEFLPKVVSQFHMNLEITLPSFCPDPKTVREQQWHTLDLVRIISHYLTRTQAWRKSERLFVIPRGPRRGCAPSKATISRWIVECIVFAYHKTGREVPRDLKAHSTRALAASWAAEARAPPDVICKAARWSSLHTFIKHYKLNVFLSQEAKFGRKVLQAVLHS